MRLIHPYTFPQKWLKGNFHCHTTQSDGTRTPEETIAAYRDDNYDFLAITDHRKYFDGKRGVELAGRMLLIPGQECHVPPDYEGFYHHMVSLGARELVPDFEDGQEIINAINARGGLAIVAHPRWSFMSYDMFDGLKDYAAFEVYNGTCEKMSRGYSMDYWDRFMTREKRPLHVVATDDSHEPEWDFATGWTWVNADRDPASILDAIRRGDVYASTGPRIEKIAVEGEAVTLWTSSAKAIKFIGRMGMLKGIVEGSNVKRATYRFNGDETFIRVEVHGHDGRIAWTNPFFLDKE